MNHRGEFSMIEEVFRPLAEVNHFSFGLSDDAAIMQLDSNQDLVVTSDAMADGIHFDSYTPAADVARKLLRSNLSDIAAMGGIPISYTLTTALPEHYRDTWIEEFAEGLKVDQKNFGVSLIGGDTISSRSLVLSMTLLGRVDSNQTLRRNGALAGDALYVSGTIGDAGIGLSITKNKPNNIDTASKKFFLDRLHKPSPRLELGQSLITLSSAAIDVSDGLIADLEHICAESKVAATVWLESVPISEAAKNFINGDSGANVARLSAGEDYELIFTAPDYSAENIALISKQLGVQITHIGSISEGRGVTVIDRDSEEVFLSSKGFSHY